MRINRHSIAQQIAPEKDPGTNRSAALKPFSGGDNWYNTCRSALAQGAPGWTRLDPPLPTAFNMRDLLASASGNPGWDYMAIRSAGELYVIQFKDGRLEMARDADGFKDLNEARHVPKLRELVAHITPLEIPQSEDDIRRKISAVKRELEVLKGDYASYWKTQARGEGSVRKGVLPSGRELRRSADTINHKTTGSCHTKPA